MEPGLEFICGLMESWKLTKIPSQESLGRFPQRLTEALDPEPGSHPMELSRIFIEIIVRQDIDAYNGRVL